MLGDGIHTMTYRTFSERCIVIYICKKSQQNVHFFANDLIKLYCLRHVSNN